MDNTIQAFWQSNKSLELNGQNYTDPRKGTPWALGRDTLGTPNHHPWDTRETLGHQTTLGTPARPQG